MGIINTGHRNIRKARNLEMGAENIEQGALLALNLSYSFMGDGLSIAVSKEILMRAYGSLHQGWAVGLGRHEWV